MSTCCSYLVYAATPAFCCLFLKNLFSFDLSSLCWSVFLGLTPPQCDCVVHIFQCLTRVQTVHLERAGGGGVKKWFTLFKMEKKIFFLMACIIDMLLFSLIASIATLLDNMQILLCAIDNTVSSISASTWAVCCCCQVKFLPHRGIFRGSSEARKLISWHQLFNKKSLVLPSPWVPLCLQQSCH